MAINGANHTELTLFGLMIMLCNVNGRFFPGGPLFSGRSDMARMNRWEVLSDGEIQLVHCVNRCVPPWCSPVRRSPKCEFAVLA